jgi:hypothetical protein
MSVRSKAVSAIAAGLIASVAVVEVAAAKCTRLGFSVNDYGKEGPIRDAKALLDKYIADWAAQRGIKGYTTGKKDVKCELFLDFGVFDEHTCRAEATVCWPGNESPGPIQAKTGDAPAPAAAKAPKAAPKAVTADPVVKAIPTAKAPDTRTAPIETGTIPVPTAGAIKPPAPAPAPAVPQVEQPPKPAQ